MRKLRNPGWYRGRMIRDGEGHPVAGGAAITTPTDGSNSAPDGSNETSPNNTGNKFDPASFWDGPAPGGSTAPAGESAGGSSQESDTGNEFAQQLTARLETMTFGEPVFTAEIAEQINEGNYQGVQDRLNAMGRQIAREALAMQVQVLRPFAEQLMAQMASRTQETFNSRDNVESLVTQFPAAKNPVVAKTIQPIYDQALKNAKGDRTKAVAETKEMLRFMAGVSAKDLGIDVAPLGQSSHKGPAVHDWLDDLTGRN